MIYAICLAFRSLLIWLAFIILISFLIANFLASDIDVELSCSVRYSNFSSSVMRLVETTWDEVDFGLEEEDEEDEEDGLEDTVLEVGWDILVLGTTDLDDVPIALILLLLLVVIGKSWKGSLHSNINE